MHLNKTTATIEQMLNWTSGQIFNLIAQGCPKSPPGGMRSGAPAPRSQGVWGLAPILGHMSIEQMSIESMSIQQMSIEHKIKQFW